jgi:hypothetical protein
MTGATVAEWYVGLPGGVTRTVKTGTDVWLFPNIHGVAPSVLSGCSVDECGVGDGGAVAAESSEDFVGCFVPDEGFGVFVPLFDPFDDVSGECVDGVVCGSLQFLGGEGGEPAFDEVHP